MGDTLSECLFVLCDRCEGGRPGRGAFPLLGGRLLLSMVPALFAAHRRSQVMSRAVRINQGAGAGGAAAFSVWSPGLKPSLVVVGFLRAEVPAGFDS